MEKKTAVDEIRERMQALQDAKAAELEKIRQMQLEESARMTAAEQAMGRATEILDADAYEKASQAKRKAQTAIEMYSGRYDQIRRREFVGEDESDRVIESLLDYENRIAEDFRTAAAAQLRTLRGLLDSYREAVHDAENVLTEWQENIHPNFRTRGGTLYYDKTAGRHTDRSKTPVPVHRSPYTGCPEADTIRDCLDQAAPMLRV